MASIVLGMGFHYRVTHGGLGADGFGIHVCWEVFHPHYHEVDGLRAEEVLKHIKAGVSSSACMFWWLRRLKLS